MASGAHIAACFHFHSIPLLMALRMTSTDRIRQRPDNPCPPTYTGNLLVRAMEASSIPSSRRGELSVLLKQFLTRVQQPSSHFSHTSFSRLHSSTSPALANVLQETLEHRIDSAQPVRWPAEVPIISLFTQLLSRPRRLRWKTEIRAAHSFRVIIRQLATHQSQKKRSSVASLAVIG